MSPAPPGQAGLGCPSTPATATRSPAWPGAERGFYPARSRGPVSGQHHLGLRSRCRPRSRGPSPGLTRRPPRGQVACPADRQPVLRGRATSLPDFSAPLAATSAMLRAAALSDFPAARPTPGGSACPHQEIVFATTRRPGRPARLRPSPTRQRSRARGQPRRQRRDQATPPPRPVVLFRCRDNSPAATTTCVHRFLDPTYVRHRGTLTVMHWGVPHGGGLHPLSIQKSASRTWPRSSER